MTDLLEKYEKWFWLFVVFCIFCAHIIDMPYTYSDTDCYMRALRITDWIDNFGWSERIFTQTNYPKGEILHWTRPVDIVWAGLYLPFAPFFETTKEAVFVAGYLLSPLFYIAVIFTLIWGLKGRFTILFRTYAIAFYLCLTGAYQAFYPERPDHHSVLAFLETFILCAFLKWLHKDKKKYIILAGIIAGLGIWIAPEFLLVFLTTLAFCVCLWLFYQHTLRPALLYTATTYFVATFGWLVNPPIQGYFYADNGRLSIAFILGLALLFISLFATHTLLKKTDTKLFKKISCLGLFGLISLAVFLLLFGVEMTNFPINEEIRFFWMRRVSEMMPMYIDIAYCSSYGFYPLITLICLIYLFFKDKSSQKVYLLYLTTLVPFMIFTFLAVRFNHYLWIFSPLTVAFVCQYFWNKKVLTSTNPQKAQWNFLASYILAVFVILTLDIFCYDSIKLYRKIQTKSLTNSTQTQMRTDNSSLPQESNSLKSQNDTQTNTELLKKSSNETNEKNPIRPLRIKSLFYLMLKEGKGTILTDVFAGPEMMWFTDRPVIAGPYHSNVEGISDIHVGFHTQRDDILEKVLRQHHVTDIVLYVLRPDAYYVFNDVTKDHLFVKLVNESPDLPKWLEKVYLQREGDKFAFIYHVNLDYDAPANEDKELSQKAKEVSKENEELLNEKKELPKEEKGLSTEEKN